ncbi:hypothetical protein DIRU0_E24740 [Diutina rugosa]
MALSRFDHGERWFSRCTPDRNMRCGELQHRSAATAPRLVSLPTSGGAVDPGLWRFRKVWLSLRGILLCSSRSSLSSRGFRGALYLEGGIAVRRSAHNRVKNLTRSMQAFRLGA